MSLKFSINFGVILGLEYMNTLDNLFIFLWNTNIYLFFFPPVELSSRKRKKETHCLLLCVCVCVCVREQQLSLQWSVFLRKRWPGVLSLPGHLFLLSLVFSEALLTIGSAFPWPCTLSPMPACLPRPVRLFVTLWSVARRAPLSLWDFPGKNTGVGCHFFFQGIFPTQGSNPGLLCLLHGRQDSWPLEALVRLSPSVKSLPGPHGFPPRSSVSAFVIIHLCECFFYCLLASVDIRLQKGRGMVVWLTLGSQLLA